MRKDGPACIIVASTAGSVMNQALTNPFFRGLVHSVVVDRQCPAVARAREHDLPVQTFFEPDPEVFSARLGEYLMRHRIDYVFSFYTSFFSTPLRDAFPDRFINLHPSLLPAFKGMDGFGDTVRYGARFAGSTIEFIDRVMDEGKIIVQTAYPLPDAAEPARIRHRLFVQQCKALVQVGRWLWEGRISVQGRRVAIAGARFDCPEFSPALDFADAIGMDIPLPTDLTLRGGQRAF
jgi:phosphoribosylglycinamide formyltransferase 1